MTITPRPRVFLTSLVWEKNPTLERLRDFVLKYPPRDYSLTNSPENAEIVLFAENGYMGLDSILRFRSLRAGPDAQCYVFSESDWPFPYLPGLYCSLHKSFPWAASWAYLLDDAEQQKQPLQNRPYLFSFMGRTSTHAVRRELLHLDTAQTPCLDTASGPERFDDWNYRRTYQQILGRSWFVLCPRGFGASSIRIFEAMRAGCVPVIIGDEWLDPPVGDWAKFCVRVEESEIQRIPEICNQHSVRAPEMGALAAKTYYEYFSPDRFMDCALGYLRSICSGRTRSGLTGRVFRSISFREFKSLASTLKRECEIKFGRHANPGT